MSHLWNPFLKILSSATWLVRIKLRVLVWFGGPLECLGCLALMDLAWRISVTGAWRDHFLKWLQEMIWYSSVWSTPCMAGVVGCWCSVWAWTLTIWNLFRAWTLQQIINVTLAESVIVQVKARWKWHLPCNNGASVKATLDWIYRICTKTLSHGERSLKWACLKHEKAKQRNDKMAKWRNDLKQYHPLLSKDKSQSYMILPF